MIIEIDLNRDQASKLLTIYRMVHDPEITSVDDYVNMLFIDLLNRIWNDVRNGIMN